MSRSCTVLIASADALPALKEQASRSEGELLAFTAADALRALEAITSRKPTVVALESVFASTPRGRALVNRIKADPSLRESEIRIVSPDTDFPRAASPRPGTPGSGGAAGPTAAVAAPAPAPPVVLDQRGTRRAPRFKVAGHVEIVVDGRPAKLIDVSRIGVQVLSPGVLKPNQRVRVGLADERGDIRLRASVAWASFEPSPSGPNYRAGIELVDANPAVMDAFISRHKQT